MSYPLIILGAGASFDYVGEDFLSSSQRSWRPPLTNEIFSPRFFEILNKHPSAKNISATILAELKHGSSFEEILSAIQSRVATHPNRYNQLTDLFFYLQELFQQISDKCSGNPANNFRTLLQAVKDKYGHALIVTFNYDNLLEDAFNGEITQSVKSYVSNPIKVFKLHGGCDWNYLHRKNALFVEQDGYEDDCDFFVKNPGVFAALIKDREKRGPEHIVRGRPYPNECFYYPALALPLQDKDSFICPAPHLALLEKELQAVDKILIIGWKAGDKKLLAMLQRALKNEVGLTVVSRSKVGVDKVFEEISKGVKLSRAAECSKGFNHFMGSTECKTFFGTG